MLMTTEWCSLVAPIRQLYRSATIAIFTVTVITVKSSRLTTNVRGISRLGSVFVTLGWLKLMLQNVFLSVDVALNVRFTKNGMCAKNNTTYMWREQAIIQWARRVISIVACCHNAKLCALSAGAFRSQQNGDVTRMWRSCRVKHLQKERGIGAVCCKKEGVLLQTLGHCCVECTIRHERDVGEKQHPYICAQTNNNRVIAACDLYCCLLPQCEALRTCRSGFPIATLAHICSWWGSQICQQMAL